MSQAHEEQARATWDVVERLMRERVEKLHGEALDARMREERLDPDDAARVARAAIAQAGERSEEKERSAGRAVEAVPQEAGERGEKSVALGERRRARFRWVWLAAAAIGATALVLAMKKKEIVAWLWREPPRENVVDAGPAPPSPEQRAAGLREKALAECADGQWTACKRDLDEALRLDPAGESDERVRQARERLDAIEHPAPPPPPPREDKPPQAPRAPPRRPMK